MSLSKEIIDRAYARLLTSEEKSSPSSKAYGVSKTTFLWMNGGGPEKEALFSLGVKSELFLPKYLDIFDW